METRQISRVVRNLDAGELVKRSVLRTPSKGPIFALVEKNRGHKLLVLGDARDQFDGGIIHGDSIGLPGKNVVISEWTAGTVALLCECQPHLLPSLPPRVGPSFGFGDITGSAVYGHIDAMCATDPDATVCPMFAQQSPRELSRTKTTVEQLMLRTQLAVMERGWNRPWSCDADHNMTTEHIDTYWAGGFRNGMYTVDPREFVQSEASRAPGVEALTHFNDLPWDELGMRSDEFLAEFGDKTFQCPDDVKITISRDEAMRAAVLYAAAVVHCHRMYQHLCTKGSAENFVLEFSVDESDADTTPAQHYIVAALCDRLGIPLFSLAPRFPGSFEKGIDYRGNLRTLAAAARQHIAIARKFGGYKLSVHSGSDKFSTYEMFAEICDGQVHVKTAGTSILEELRMLARYEPAIFREALDRSTEHFEEARKTYVIAGTTAEIVGHQGVEDQGLEGLLFASRSTRQCLHVNFGEIMDLWGEQMRSLRWNHRAEFDLNMAAWLARHVQPFVRA